MEYAKYLRISLNPSSWFTNQFVEFYKENYDKDYHFEIYTAGVRTVMERVRDYLSDIGFVYVMEQQKKNSSMSWRKTSWFLPLCRKVRRHFIRES